jgi:pimeloyl-ACP methyl ester carboxylesterase
MDRRRPADFGHILKKLSELAELAQHISWPVLVVKGGRSAALTEQDADSFARAFPNGRWQIVGNAGHNVQEDNPKGLANELRRHFAGAKTDPFRPLAVPATRHRDRPVRGRAKLDFSGFNR